MQLITPLVLTDSDQSLPRSQLRGQELQNPYPLPKQDQLDRSLVHHIDGMFSPAHPDLTALLLPGTRRCSETQHCYRNCFGLLCGDEWIDECKELGGRGREHRVSTDNAL